MTLESDRESRFACAALLALGAAFAAGCPAAVPGAQDGGANEHEPQCAGPGELLCGGECVDAASDARHCGGCGQACTDAACVSGVCGCPEGKVPCQNGCVAACVLVAAVDSSAQFKANADFHCDGQNDQEEINAAFAALPQEGGTVVLSGGTFKCTGSSVQPPEGGYADGPIEDPNDIVPTAGSTLLGQGKDSTVIYYTSSRNVTYDWDFRGCVRVRHPHVTVQDFSVTGQGWVYVSASSAKIVNVRVSNTEASSKQDHGPNAVQAAFLIRADKATHENIELNGCEAINSPSFGFMLDGACAYRPQGADGCGSDPSTRWSQQSRDLRTIRNLKLINCIARKDAPYDETTPRYSDWDVGFDVPERAVLENTEIRNCVAQGFYESGFHSEVSTWHDNTRFINCTSQNNGYKPGALWGSGWHLSNGWGPGPVTLEGCHAKDNAIAGYYVDWANNFAPTASLALNACTDDSSAVGFQVVYSENVSLTGCTSRNAAGYGFEAMAGSRVAADLCIDSPGGEDGYLNFVADAVSTSDFDLTVYKPGAAESSLVRQGNPGSNTFEVSASGTACP